jgi:hypothetical protein
VTTLGLFSKIDATVAGRLSASTGWLCCGGILPMDEHSKATGTDVVMVERERYERLLIELGELRQLKESIHEYKTALFDKDRELKEKERELEEIKEILLETEWKDYELEQTQKRLEELQMEVERLMSSKSWWRRLLR